MNGTTYHGVAEERARAVQEFENRQQAGENVGLVESRYVLQKTYIHNCIHRITLVLFSNDTGALIYSRFASTQLLVLQLLL